MLDLVDQLNRDHNVDGVLVQLPLPSHINEHLVCQSINPYKDVDGFHMCNVGKFIFENIISRIIGRYCLGHPAFIPATPLGVLEMLKRCHVETFGKTACVVGRSKNIGICMEFLNIDWLTKLHCHNRFPTSNNITFRWL